MGLILPTRRRSPQTIPLEPVTGHSSVLHANVACNLSEAFPLLLLLLLLLLLPLLPLLLLCLTSLTPPISSVLYHIPGKMVRSNHLRFMNVLRELNRRETIPQVYLKDLEQRLVVTFKKSVPGRRIPNKARRSKEEYKLQYTAKKAQQIYVEVAEDLPYLYIPFILAISPKSCEKFDLGLFRRERLTETVNLKDNIRLILEDIATRNEFDQDRLFRKLIRTLFQGSSSLLRISFTPLTSGKSLTMAD